MGYEIFFDDLVFHCLAWFLLYFRAMMLFLSHVPGLRWLPVTITLASVRSLYFGLAHCVLVAGFATVAYIQFGARWVQFSSFSRAFWELFILSCGVPGTVFDDIYPFQERASSIASMYLAMYLILAVSIGLNFFTTIILDAYNLALDPSAANIMIQNSKRVCLEALMCWVGVPVDQGTLSGEGAAVAGLSMHPVPDETRRSHSRASTYISFQRGLSVSDVLSLPRGKTRLFPE